MAQNITLMGASYSDCPAVLLPKTGGGTARFDDASVTTAGASDVASGKIFLASDGTITTGTASGGGASNYVHGEFTAGSSGNGNVNISYSGSGYPIMVYIVIKGGAYVTGTAWYDSLEKGCVGAWAMSKSVFSSTPTFTTSGAENQGVVLAVYKSSTSSSTSYTRTSSMTANIYTSSDGGSTAATCVRFKSKTSFNYKICPGTASFGLRPSQTYEYFIVYSS